MVPPGSFITELKRRRVVRVAAIYLVAAWVAIQVAATVFPVLELPGWTTKLVVALAAAGLPVVLALAWVFQARGRPEGTEQVAPGAGGRRFKAMPALALAALVAAVVAGIWLNGRSEAAVVADDTLVAALPFRVSGGPDLEYLREGIVDLVAAKLTGMPRAVDPRAVLAAWHRKARGGDEMAEAEATELARSLGAGQVLLGSVVGNASTVTLTARLVRVRDGSELATATVSGAADSVTVMIDRLLSDLVAQQSSEPRARLSALTTTSLPALRAYLEGRVHYRAGRYGQSIDAYDLALELDSTFALAALGVMDANNMAVDHNPSAVARATRLARAHRHRLPPADLIYLESFVASARTAAEKIAILDQAVRRIPDRAEAWYNLGDWLTHFGPRADIDDHFQRAKNAFGRALALDSTYSTPTEHLAMIAQVEGDTAELRRQTSRFRPGSDMYPVSPWMLAIAARDTAAIARIGARLDTVPSGFLEFLLWGFGADMHIGVDLTRQAGELLLDRATTGEEAGRSRSLMKALALNAGWPTLVEEMHRASHYSRVATASHERILAALYWDGDTAGLGRDIAALTRAGDRIPNETCTLAQWLAWRGDAVQAEREAARLRVHADSTLPVAHEICIALVGAIAAHVSAGADADARLLALDSLMGMGPGGNLGAAANLTLARLFGQRGDVARGLRASRRRVVMVPDMELYRAPLLRQEAYLAARASERDAAIAAYRLYLDMRREAEPGSRARAEYEAARNEFAQLTRERE